MDRRDFITAAAVVVAAGALFPASVLAGQKDLPLPAPDITGGKPLMAAIKSRRSERAFKTDPLPAQVLANLLWAGFGVNRQDSNKRTAPSCKNWQEMDIYAAAPEGLYRYDAKAHTLLRVHDNDIRSVTGKQAFAADAPLNLVFVADIAKTDIGGEEGLLFIGADTAFISQNIYLYCASEGLATVVRANFDKNALAKEMGLRPDQRIILAQTVGYPKA